MGEYDKKPEKASSRPTAGPSEDDRFGGGEVGVDVNGRIMKADIVDGQTRVTIARGTMHGVRMDMEGYVKGAGGSLSALRVVGVREAMCFADLDITLDQLGTHQYVVINPATMPRGSLTKDTPTRVLAVHVEDGRTKITIARGSAHGVAPGMRGQLRSADGSAGAAFTIEGTTAQQSFAYVGEPIDHVNGHQSVVLHPKVSSRAAIQRRAQGEASAADANSTAQAGVADATSRLPHFDAIQRAFGKHDISGIQAQVGGAAGGASQALGAKAYATGNKVAFDAMPDLHTAAHEAAHVIQQSRGAVGFQGLGAADDEHERHADAVADAVVAGQSAEPLLDRLGGANTSGSATGSSVQLKPRDGKRAAPKADDKTPKPTVIDASVAFEHLKEGQDARAGLAATKMQADALYGVILAQAKSLTIHEQATKAYEATKVARRKMLEKGTFEKVMTAVTTLVEFGLAVYSVIGAAKKVMDAAKNFKQAYKSYDAEKSLPPIPGVDSKELQDQAKKHLYERGKEGAVEVFNGGKSGKDLVAKSGKLTTSSDRETPDPDTILSDVNAQAIKDGHAALDVLVEADMEFSLVSVYTKYTESTLNLKQMSDGMALLRKENKVLPDESLQMFNELISQCESSQRQVQASVERLSLLWKAYGAGGAEALSDTRERGLFEKIQAWRAAKDPKGTSMVLAMDQAHKQIRFTPGGIGHHINHVSSTLAIVTNFHSYQEQAGQSEQGTLYIRDPVVAKELLEAGLIIPDTSTGLDVKQGGPGIAETEANKAGGQKFTISISMCKALISLGLGHQYAHATVKLWVGEQEVAQIWHPHRGDWFDKAWMNTPEFAAFWRTHLGGTYGFVGKGVTGEPKRIGLATPEEVARSQRHEPTGFARPGLRE